MQTLRKRTSPCKYKNDPSRFLGEGITFKAKLIGILEVSEARGDKMCQDALNDLKTAIRAAGEHKQRITIGISIDGLRLRDEKTGDCLYHHPVHKISFIAQDMSDSRAFGYIFGSPDTGHRFFGIKTDKTASQVVISMRDLFQVVFELKKKEIEMAKHHSEQHNSKFGSTSYVESLQFTKDDSEAEKGKMKYSQLLKSRCQSSKSYESTSSETKDIGSEAIADLLDLEHELNSIQQGINQMDKITPSDPFGPISKSEAYDPFDDSFTSKIQKSLDDKPFPEIATGHQQKTSSDFEKDSSLFASTASSNKTLYIPPGLVRPKANSCSWFDHEPESMFDESTSSNLEQGNSPLALSNPLSDNEQSEGKKSPTKTDLFTELDPLGTGRVKPYVDKKDFFQELKNPPKKVLKELITDGTPIELSSVYFPTQFKNEKIIQNIFSDSVDHFQDFKDPNSKYAKVDPFDNTDPFEKTDPFPDDGYTYSADFPQIFGEKPSFDELFDDKVTWKLEKSSDLFEEKSEKNIFARPPSGPKTFLHPENENITTTLNQISSPKFPEESNLTRRKFYQTMKQSTVDGNGESYVHEESFVKSRATPFESKPEVSHSKNKVNSFQSFSFGKSDKSSPSKRSSSVEILDATTPDPPPRAKTALFLIKPPPLPPKKQIQSLAKPPARPPLDDCFPQYDYLEKNESLNNEIKSQDLKCVKLKNQLSNTKESCSASEMRKRSSEPGFPFLPPPPQQRKTSSDVLKGKSLEEKQKITLTSDGSVLNIKLTQLDDDGLENLATTLGIPYENVYSMTLQDLTKMLAVKFLPLKTQTREEVNATNSFEVDFDANFGKTEEINTQLSYDKYAVFKELVKNENTNAEQSKNNNLSEKTGCVKKGEKVEREIQVETKPEEDKYAALRQLSLNQNVEVFSEEDDNLVEVSLPREKQAPDIKESTPPIADAEKLEVTDKKGGTPTAVLQNCDFTTKSEWVNPERFKGKNETVFVNKGQLFPLVDQFTDEQNLTPKQNDWATFDKSDFHETIKEKSSSSLMENDHSPLSSDGKEEIAEQAFQWHQKTYKKKNKREVPWQDDDESWDDYSPKESFCSDESSHDDRSPEGRRVKSYKIPSWNTKGKPFKSNRVWSDARVERGRRYQWHDDTEDEFEESWRKQRKERSGSYESGRKIFWQENTYDSYSNRYECYAGGEEGWKKNDRYSTHYGNRHNRPESDNDFRKTCDSDTSDKESIWMSQKNYLEGRGRIPKQKQHHDSGNFFRDRPGYFHEPRSRHKKGVGQKRPSSASELKRNYDKTMSPGEHSHRSSDKTYPGKRNAADEEFFRHQRCLNESRDRGDLEMAHYHSCEWKTSTRNSKPSTKVTKTFDFVLPASKREDGNRSKHESFDCFKSFEESHKKMEKKNYFVSGSEAESFKKNNINGSNDSKESPEKRKERRTLTEGKSGGDTFLSRVNNESFPAFRDGRPKKSPSKTLKKSSETGCEDCDVSQGKLKTCSEGGAYQEGSEGPISLRKSDSINIFSRDKEDPFEGDDFFSSTS